ncbi:MAG: hypothetical protein ACLVFD_05905 [Anaerostipes hadrus]
MAIVVSKVDALLEMVKAYDNNQVKRSNCIGRILITVFKKIIKIICIVVI